MTSLVDAESPLYWEAYDVRGIKSREFQMFIARAAYQGFIRPGSLVIWDNARAHLADDIQPNLARIFEAVGADWRNLPKYSPEFNPCELVFAQVKCYMRNNFRPNMSLMDRVVEALGSVRREHVEAYYEHCNSTGIDCCNE
jgi:hypothetical protein